MIRKFHVEISSAPTVSDLDHFTASWKKANPETQAMIEVVNIPPADPNHLCVFMHNVTDAPTDSAVATMLQAVRTTLDMNALISEEPPATVTGEESPTKAPEPEPGQRQPVRESLDTPPNSDATSAAPTA